MIFKETVTRQGVQPPVFFACGVAEMVWREAGFICVVTSMTDSHADKPASLHNKGLAVDFRTRDIPATHLQKVSGSMKAILEPLGYDVVLEFNPPHLHIEYQPKGLENWITLELQK